MWHFYFLRKNIWQTYLFLPNSIKICREQKDFSARFSDKSETVLLGTFSLLALKMSAVPQNCSVYEICVNHKTELIDFNRRILNHKLLTVTEQNGTATLSKTQRVHNESKFQHGGSLVQSSTFFLSLRMCRTHTAG